MKPQKLFAPFLMALSLAVMLWANCSDNDSTSPNEDDGPGILKVLLTDAPAEYDSVKVTFSQIAVHRGDTTSTGADSSGGEWIIIDNGEQTYDLLTLSGGVTALMGEAELEAGHYTQLRLILTGAEVVVDSVSYPLTVPSGTLKFVNGFDISADEPVTLIIDFDAAKSINQTGNGTYKLKPVIRVLQGDECGSIGGMVTNYEHKPIAYAIAGTDTVTTSTVNPESGVFVLPALLGGSYTVAFEDTLGQRYDNAAVSVTLGERTNLGSITLE